MARLIFSCLSLLCLQFLIRLTSGEPDISQVKQPTDSVLDKNSEPGPALPYPGFQPEPGPKLPYHPGFQPEPGPALPYPGFQPEPGPKLPYHPGFQPEPGPKLPYPGFQPEPGPGAPYPGFRPGAPFPGYKPGPRPIAPFPGLPHGPGPVLTGWERNTVNENPPELPAKGSFRSDPVNPPIDKGCKLSTCTVHKLAHDVHKYDKDPRLEPSPPKDVNSPTSYGK